MNLRSLIILLCLATPAGAIQPPIPSPIYTKSVEYKKRHDIESIEIPPPLEHLDHDKVQQALFDGRLQDLPDKEKDEYNHWLVDQQEIFKKNGRFREFNRRSMK